MGSVPRHFQSLRALRNLNVAAVALALASITSAVFGLFVASEGRFGLATLVTGLPTLVVGAVWAAVLRWRATVGRTSFRWAWLLSVPLAMVNAGLAGAILMGPTGGGPVLVAAVSGFLLGCTFGAVIWIPALLATLVAFGIPIAWSQSLAKRGLAGEERGEWVVGLSCAALSLVALIFALVAPDPPGRILSELEASAEPMGRWLLYALATLGGAAGAATTVLARLREGQRRRFVADAEEGKVKGYRVDPSPEGKVLVRVTSHGEGYRVADFREEVFSLDEQGEAKQALFLDSPRGR